MTGPPIITDTPDLLLRARNLRSVRGHNLLFDGLNITLCAGQSLWIRGPNGAGKTTLLRMLAGLLPCPASGLIERICPLAHCDDKSALDQDETLLRTLSFWAKLDGTSLTHVDRILKQLDLSHLADIPVRILSTGQRKRAVLARVLISKSRLWLLDEPGNGMDGAALAILSHAIAQHKSDGGGVIWTSHFPLADDWDQEITLSPTSARAIETACA